MEPVAPVVVEPALSKSSPASYGLTGSWSFIQQDRYYYYHIMTPPFGQPKTSFSTATFCSGLYVAEHLIWDSSLSFQAILAVKLFCRQNRCCPATAVICFLGN